MKLRFKRRIPIRISDPQEARVLQIVGDAAIATVNVGDGRLIPLVIIDTTDRPDIDEVIQAHDHFDDGDVTIQWGTLKQWPKHVALVIYFQRPIERTAIIVFDIGKHGILVEHALLAGAIYVQTGRSGDRLKHDINRRKIIMEVPNTDFYADWSKIYFNDVLRRVISGGHTRKEARSIAENIISKIRELASVRAKFRQ